MKSKKFYIKTFGCQMNEYDSNKISELLKSISFKRIDEIGEADCFIFNTCHIRDKATQKVYSDIGKIKKIYKNKPKPIFVLAGCVAQAESSIVFEKSDYVDIVVGPQAYHKLPNMIKNFIEKRDRQVDTNLNVDEKFDALQFLENKLSKVSSFITIQEGCDKFCKFCVVPYTRGPEFSRDYKKIIDEAKSLSENGAREIVLLGQNVRSYKYNDVSLAKLIKKISKIEDIKRIRFTTSHPNDFDEELISLFGEEPKLMPQLHLPVQSGSNKILKLMNRNHTRDDYLNLIDRFRNKKPDIQFSSDFIVGYPGETEGHFQLLRNFIEEIKFERLGIFTYSEEEGTVASELKDDVARDVKDYRKNLLQDIQQEISFEKNSSFIGKELKVIIDKSANKVSIGRTEYDSPEIDNIVHVKGKAVEGSFVNVKIEKVNEYELIGNIV